MTVRQYLTISIAFLFSIKSYAQEFGGNPPSLKWQQVNTKAARIIFSKGLETQARRIASIMDTLSNSTLSTAGGSQKKINVVLHNQTTISNGSVGLAPFRSEFEMMPDQNSFELGSLPWEEQLATHEYRHVQQYNNFRVGLSKLFYFLFGEGGQELANSTAVPNWFWEGDAVFQETYVTKQGRGRLPWFFNGYHSLWASGKKYSYLKLRNGSLRDYVPDHYPLGYMLVAYGREKYGDDFWKKVTRDAASYKGLFYPMQKAIHRYAGISFKEFYKNAFTYFNNFSKENIDKDSAAILARNQKHFLADEEFPQFINDSSIVFVKTTYKQAPAFFIKNIKDGTETKIKTRSISLDNYFSYGNNKIVYAAYQPDIRWNWRDYSVLRVLDITTGDERQITSHSKYFAPDISADGKQIVAVQINPEGKSELEILNTENGSIEKTIPNKDSLFYTHPKFYNDNEIVSCVRNSKGEMALGLFNINNGNAIYLTPFSMNVLDFPSVQDSIVYFSASHKGRDQTFAASPNCLWKVNLSNNNIATGDYQLNTDANEYVWTSFTAMGFTIFHSPKNALSFEKIQSDNLTTPLTAQGIHAVEKEQADLADNISSKDYPVTKYASSFKLFNFHSWRPYFNDPDYYFSLVSENILNTLESEVYVDYNRNEKSKQVGFDAVYGQLFPWIDGSIDYTFDRNAFYRNNKVFWNEAEAKAGLSIPLNFTKGGHYTFLQIGNDFVFNQRYYQGSYKDTFSNKSFEYINSYLSFSNQIQSTRQQIYPQLAQSLTVMYKRAISAFSGNQLLASAYFYLPGISQTNSLVLSAAFQQRDNLQQVFFSNSFPFSRGYSSENFYRMYRLGASYHFTVAYPDWGFGGIAYFLRVRADVFYDYTSVNDFYLNGSKFYAPFRSYGTEIYVDSKWWNLLPISFGIRYSHLIDRDVEGRSPNQWELILPINLLSR